MKFKTKKGAVLCCLAAARQIAVRNAKRDRPALNLPACLPAIEGSGPRTASFLLDSGHSGASFSAGNGENAVNGARIVGGAEALKTRAGALDDFPTGFQATLSVLEAS